MDAPDGSGGKVRKYFVGEDGAGVWRDGMEVGTIMSDGVGKSRLVFDACNLR